MSVFEKTLEACAISFLYVFIRPGARLNATIMRKRANQIAALKKIDAANPQYTYSDLVAIVQRGIEKQYGMPPSALLTQLYNASKGIGTSPLASETERAQANLQRIKNMRVTQGEKKNSNFWETLNNVLPALQEILSVFGGKNPNGMYPHASDWASHNPDTNIGDMLATFLPWAAAAGVLFFALNQKSKNTKKKRR